MKKKKDYLAVVISILTMIASGAGIMSINFTKAYDFVNLYGHTVKMYGYGIYANDTYFQAPISIGADICLFFLVVPMLFIVYRNYVKRGDMVSQLKLISIYSTILYYAASIAFGLTYNRLFLIYMALFSSSLFGMFRQICNLKLTKAVPLTKGLEAFLVICGIALVVAWLPDIVPTVLHGGTLSLIGIYTTCITYVLDMGIICPLCFVIIYLLKKGKPLGTILLAILLELCTIIAITIIAGTVCQILSGCDLPLAVVLTKMMSFVILGGFALYFDRKVFGFLGDSL